MENQLSNLFLIFLGAGCGGLLRYWISNAIYLLTDKQFPYGTLVVNVSGSLIMGFLFALIVERFNTQGPHLRSLLLIGLLGGYTTFSSFSIETINLIENSQYSSAILNMMLSTFLCVSAAWVGVIGGRYL